MMYFSTLRVPALLTFSLILSGYALSRPQEPAKPDIQRHAQLAQQALQANKPADAIREFQAILSLDPKNTDALANLGVVEFFQGDFSQATGQLRAALALQPNLSKLRALLGMSEKRIGETRGAQTDLQTAFAQLQEEKLRVQTGLELIEVDYALNDLGKAAEVVEVLRQLRPADPDVLFTAHRVYSDLADETTLGLAIAAPHSARLKQLMGHELARRADREGAIAQYRAAIRLEPKLSDLHFELGDMLRGSSSATDQSEAEKEYKIALQLNPFDEKSTCRLGDLAAKRSETQAALAYYSRAYQLQPNDVDVNLGLARILMSMHQPDKAQVHLERAVQVEPYDPAVHYRLGVVYRELGRTDDGKRELAEFERLKKMKNDLQSLYQAMRLEPGKQDRLDSEVPQ
jgi:tetratricopeptide (TPR) repeat protein